MHVPPPSLTPCAPLSGGASTCAADTPALESAVVELQRDLEALQASRGALAELRHE